MKSTPVEIVVLHAPWRRALPQAAKLARQAARAALKGAGHDGDSRMIAIALGDDALLRDLNARYRGKDKPTNVLSFATGEPDRLGDIALSLQTLRAEARAQGKMLQAHFLHLVVHGTLHLLGHDHMAAAEADRMEKLERQILAGLGIADPYQSPARPPAPVQPRKPAKKAAKPKR